MPLSRLGSDFCFFLACTSMVKIWISVSRKHQSPPVGDWPGRGTHQPRESSCVEQSGGYLPRCREEELVYNKGSFYEIDRCDLLHVVMC